MGEYELLRKKIFFIGRSAERLHQAIRLDMVKGDEAWWHFMRREAWLHLKRSVELLYMVLRKRNGERR